MTEPEEGLLVAKVVEGRDTSPLITCRDDRRPPSDRVHAVDSRARREPVVEAIGGRVGKQIGCQNRSADQVVRAAVPRHTGLNERRCCCHHCRGPAHHHAGPRGSATKHRAPVPHRETEPEEDMLVAEVVEGRDTNPLITCRDDHRAIVNKQSTREPEGS